MQMIQCDNKHLTWCMTELSNLFNQRRILIRFNQSISLAVVPLEPTFMMSSSYFSFYVSSPFSMSLISLHSRLIFSHPPFYHSAVFTVIHYHFFRQLALTVLSFVRSHWQRPLGDKEMTEGGLYLPLWPLPCRLLNHVANRQHCLPACPHPDNGEPHSYLIQWSV